MADEFLDARDLEWRPHRLDVAHGVYAKTFSTGEVKVSLVRVIPGGAFTPHRDTWGHIFFFLSGEGRATVGETTSSVKAESVVSVLPGVTHSYENTGSSDLTLISINLPPTNRRRSAEGAC